jgi:hypothetical protein
VLAGRLGLNASDGRKIAAFAGDCLGDGGIGRRRRADLWDRWGDHLRAWGLIRPDFYTRMVLPSLVRTSKADGEVVQRSAGASLRGRNQTAITCR